MNYKSLSNIKKFAATMSLVLGSTVHAAPTSLTAVFTMRDPTGAIVPSPDSTVTGSFDLAAGTFALQSTTPFQGLQWSTHDGTFFAPGTYTISTADTTGNTCGSSFAICASAGTVTFTVPTGHVGGHVKFAWGATDGIDVFMIWDTLGNSIDFGGTVDGVTVTPDGYDGFKMVDGPFTGFSADFDLSPSPAATTSPSASNSNLIVIPNGATNSWTPNVTQITGSSSTCTITSAATTGTATIASDCSSGNFDATALNLNATDSFSYTITDGFFGTTATATVSVVADPNFPITSNGTATASGTTATTIDLTTLVSDGDDNVTTYTIVTNPSHGSLVNNNNGTVTYTANSNYSGEDSFVFNVTDATAKTSGNATVTVTVQATTPSVTSGAFAVGPLASSAGSSTGGGLTTAIVGTDSSMEQQCIGGCFDFTVSGLTSGGTATVVLPLSTAIPAKTDFNPNIVYRKKSNGNWRDFDSSGSNAVASANALSANPTVCPEPGSSSYSPGLNAGFECVQLTIVDGGPNDDDGLANGTVVDPGGIGVGASITSSIDEPAIGGGAGGCTLGNGRNPVGLEWLALLGGLVGLGLWRKRQG